MFARFTCGNNRLVSPSWALFFVKAPHSELVRIGHLKECLLDMDGVHIGANLGLRVAYRCLHSPGSRGAHGSPQHDRKKLTSSGLSSFNIIAQ